MKNTLGKLIWSAFAMSLILGSPFVFSHTEGVEDFLGLETDISPELLGPQKFSPKDMHEQNPEWSVTEKQVEQDKEPLKNQGYSLIPWSTQDPEEWLSAEKWIAERMIKDKTPDWKMRLRDMEQKELVGKILQCKGECQVYRGSNFVKGAYLSRILEGDEIITMKNSIAWVYLMDGSIVRLGPETSLTLQEINFSLAETMVLTRLNNGHVYWSSRNQETLAVNTDPETDSLCLPLMVKEANQEFFERELFQSKKDQEYLNLHLEWENLAINAQFTKINELKKANSETSMPPTKVLMVTPNSTFIAVQSTFDLFYNNGGEAHFKERNSPLGNVEIQQRGYLNDPMTKVSKEVWYKVSSNGRSVSTNDEPPSVLLIPELLTKRIKSIELAREIWVSQFTVPVMKVISDPKKLATEFGYNLWNEDLAKRTEFLVEYSRRIETTHLRSIENLVSKLEANGEVISREPTSLTYQASLNHYLKGLKNRNSKKKMQVREMNNLQYYVWILINGKL